MSIKWWHPQITGQTNVAYDECLLELVSPRGDICKILNVQ